jgi:hypothetical protein
MARMMEVKEKTIWTGELTSLIFSKTLKRRRTLQSW